MITNHRLSILHRPKRPLAAQKNVEHADQEFQKEQVCMRGLHELYRASLVLSCVAKPLARSVSSTDITHH